MCKEDLILVKNTKIDFKKYSERLTSSSYDIYPKNLKKFIYFMWDNNIIKAYIDSCGEISPSIEEYVEKLLKCRGTIDVSQVNEDGETLAIFQVLKYFVDKNIDIITYAFAYSRKPSHDERLCIFNDSVVSILINNINSYLDKKINEYQVMIDSKNEHSSTFTQNNFASDNASINVVNNVNFDSDYQEIIKNLLDIIESISNEKDKVFAKDCLNCIDNYLKTKEKPDRKFLDYLFDGLKGIKYTAEFSAAVTTLISFVMRLIN